MAFHLLVLKKVQYKAYHLLITTFIIPRTKEPKKSYMRKATVAITPHV